MAEALNNPTEEHARSENYCGAYHSIQSTAGECYTRTAVVGEKAAVLPFRGLSCAATVVSSFITSSILEESELKTHYDLASMTFLVV